MALKLGNNQGFTSLLKDGYKHFEEAVYRNVAACNDISAITRSSFGPHGMNKMIVNNLEKLFVTNDAATIMSELEVVHPAAKLLVMASRQQEHESGDGTNLVLVLAGELLKKAEDLLKIGMHPSEIIDGYEKAFGKAMEHLESLVIKTVGSFTEPELKEPVGTAIASKQYGLESFLSHLIIKASLAVMPKSPKLFNVDAVRVVKILGGSIMDSTVVHGMVFGRQAESSLKNVINANVAVFSCPLDIGQTETKGTVLIHDAKELLSFSRGEEKALERQFQDIADTGANVLVTAGGIGELALHFINRFHLMAIKVPSKFDLQRLCRVTGATVIARLGPPTAEEMGKCEIVESIEIGSDRCTVFRQEHEQTKTSSIVLRGSTLNYLDDIERSIDDGINVIKSLTKDGRLLPGAGATEIQLAELLQDYSAKTPGLGQYGIKKFSEALESIPAALSENAGLSSTEVLAKLYAAHSSGNRFAGVDIESLDNRTLDAVERGILDVYASKKSALHLATEAALSVLRVDSIIMSKPAGGPKPRAPTGGMDAEDD